MTKITNLVNSRWQKTAILKMILSLYLSRGSSDFDEICGANACFNSENDHPTKNQNFAYSKWRTDGSHLEYCNLVTSPRIIVWLMPNLV